MAKRFKRGGKKANKPDKYAKQKMLAIPVLLAVLGYVLLDNFGGSSEDSTAQAPPRVAQSSDPTGRPNAAAEKHPSKQLAAWPDPELGFLGAPSPLASYRAAAGEIVRPEDSRLVDSSSETMLVQQQVQKKNQIEDSIRATLSSQTSQFIFKSANRKLALVGDRIVEQGERLDGGGRLHDVRGNNLVFEVGRRID